MGRSKHTVDDVWRKVQWSYGCWPWQGSLDNGGYGICRVENRTTRPHRVAFQFIYGPIPKGLQVCHRCDNRLCCRPSHLFLGTSAENTADREAKGRGAKGSKQGNSKINEIQALSIRKDARSQNTIAREYGISQTTVWEIKCRRTWKHIA